MKQEIDIKKIEKAIKEHFDNLIVTNFGETIHKFSFQLDCLAADIKNELEKGITN